MNLIVSYVFLLFVVLSQCSLFKSNTSSLVVDFDDDSFLKEVLGGADVWIVALYKPEEEDSQKIVPIFEEVSGALGGLVKVGAVDASQHLKFLAENTKTYPTILAFPSKYTGSKGKPPLPIPFREELTASTIEKWALKQLPTAFVHRVRSKKDFKDLDASIDTIPHAVFFHNNSIVPYFLRTLSLTLADKLLFVEVRATNKTKDISKKYKVTEIPTLVVRPLNSEEEEVKVYDGELKYQPIYDFVSSFGLSDEKRNALQEARRKKHEEEEKQRKEKEEKERAKQQAEEEARAAEKKRIRRAKRAILMKREAEYSTLEKQWESLDGEYIQVRDADWKEIEL